MNVWLERDRHHIVERKQLNYCVGPVGGLPHLAISVPGMIIFLAKARTSPPKYPTNTTFKSPITDVAEVTECPAPVIYVDTWFYRSRNSDTSWFGFLVIASLVPGISPHGKRMRMVWSYLERDR